VPAPAPGVRPAGRPVPGPHRFLPGMPAWPLLRESYDRPSYFPFDPDTSGFPGGPGTDLTYVSGAYTCGPAEKVCFPLIGHSIPVRHEGESWCREAPPAFGGGIAETDSLPRYGHLDEGCGWADDLRDAAALPSSRPVCWPVTEVRGLKDSRNPHSDGSHPEFSLPAQ
jgi:hypothetical protein